jgi:hypothetical protein
MPSCTNSRAADAPQAPSAFFHRAAIQNVPLEERLTRATNDACPSRDVKHDGNVSRRPPERERCARRCTRATDDQPRNVVGTRQGASRGSVDWVDRPGEVDADKPASLHIVPQPSQPEPPLRRFATGAYLPVTSSPLAMKSPSEHAKRQRGHFVGSSGFVNAQVGRRDILVTGALKTPHDDRVARA